MNARLLLVALVLVTGLACRRDSTRPVIVPVEARRVPSPQLLRELALMATDKVPSNEELERWHGDIEDGKKTVEDFVDAQLADTAFSRTTAPRLLLGMHATIGFPAVFRVGAALKQTETTPPVHFLLSPCEAKDAVKVKPWWGGDEILICPSSYLPENFADASGRACSGSKLLAEVAGMVPVEPSANPVCGCGPQLMRCFPDEPSKWANVESFTSEINDTVGHIIESDRFIGDIYTTNETERNARIDFFYDRWLVEAGQKKSLDPRPANWAEAPSRWAKRYEQMEGAHAGVLTTPNMLFGDKGGRPMMRDLYEAAWCVEPEAGNVKTEDVLHLGQADMRAGAGWQELAERPVCTGCHARLDYSRQFFNGFADNRQAMHFDARHQDVAPGKLYGRNIRDYRGEQARTPQNLGRFVVSQPEFAACITRKVVGHVFGDQTTVADRRAVETAFTKTHGNFRQVMREALVRFAAREATVPAAPHWGSGEKNSMEARARVPESVKRLLSQSCAECHGTDEWLEKGLARSEMEDVVRQVSTSVMPPSDAERPLASAEREQLVAMLGKVLWKDPDERQAALDDFARSAKEETMAPAPHSVSVEIPMGPANGKKIVLSRQTRAQLQTTCSGCHPALSNVDSAVTQEMGRALLNNLAFGRMPPPGRQALEPDTRARMSRELVTAIYPDAGDQQAAWAYFGQQMRALRTLRHAVAATTVRNATGAEGSNAFGVTPDPIYSELQQVTPGLVADLAFEALNGCRQGKKSGDALDACLTAALRPETFALEALKREAPKAGEGGAPAAKPASTLAP